MSDVTLRRNEQLAGNLDTSFLKILALCFMLCDHLGASLYPNFGELRIIGRMALPLYAWCLVVGSVKTHNPIRYILRLLGLAVFSQPLYMLALNHTWKDMNILFTLAIAATAIQGIRQRRYGSEWWVPAACYLLLGFIKVDYGWRGLTFILLLYLARETRSGLIATYLGYALFWGASSMAIKTLFGIDLAFLRWPGIGEVLSAFFRLQSMVWLALPLIVCKTEATVQIPKWLGYGLYPMHLVLLIVLKLMSGYSWAMLARGF